ncbi:hypothetical protein THAOC_08427, partial [Thalassiosira oceanica]
EYPRPFHCHAGGRARGVCPAAPLGLRWAGFGSCVDEKRDPFHVAKISNQINPAPPTSFSLSSSQKKEAKKAEIWKVQDRRQAERRSIAHTTSQEEKVGLSNPILLKGRLRRPIERSADEISPSETSDQSALDQILAKLTSMFPLFVLGSAILGSCQPRTLQWVNAGQIISLMLGAVMLATGMSLQKADFTNILTDRTQRKSIPIGVMCQFMLMPLSASLVGRTFLLPYCDPNTAENLGKHLFLGLVLVGCSPGGTASNLVSLIAGADVALSVLLTAASTILASAVTPLLTKLIVGSAVPVSGMSLCVACAKVVLAPVALGVLMNETTPKVCRWVSRFTPFASVVLVSLICGGVVANNASMWTGSSMSLPVLILLSVIMVRLRRSTNYLEARLLTMSPLDTLDRLRGRLFSPKTAV